MRLTTLRFVDIVNTCTKLQYVADCVRRCFIQTVLAMKYMRILIILESQKTTVTIVGTLAGLTGKKFLWTQNSKVKMKS
jgi:hypothetical protein